MIIGPSEFYVRASITSIPPSRIPASTCPNRFRMYTAKSRVTKTAV